jgi:hypothetical protein
MMSSSDEDASDSSSPAAGLLLSGKLTAADRLLEVAEHGLTTANGLLDPGGGCDGGSPGPKMKTLEERLLELHIEESAKAAKIPSSLITNGGVLGSTSSSHHLNPCSNLVSLLCRRDRCNRLLVTLLPDNEGYSVHVVTMAAATAVMAAQQQQQPNEVELFRLPYEDNDFMTYVDNEELPTSIIDLLEKAWPELFYSGCVIAEIRDHRRLTTTAASSSEGSSSPSTSAAGTTTHVLLRPTTQSIICDGYLICERAGWTTREERAMVESQLCLATEAPLCLDPDPVVSILARKSCVRRQKFATPSMRRHAKRFSQVGINRKRKLDEASAPPELKLYDFVQNLNRVQQRPNPQEMLQKHQAVMRNSLRSIVQTASVNGIEQQPATTVVHTDVAKHAKAIVKRPEVTDMTPHVVEEYILETAERGAARIYHTKLTIYQRLANDEYLGELYVERDFREKDKKGSTCRFVLGTRPHALRYINQFTEIFTEEGRKPVKITHLVPNQKPRITFTPGMRERMNERAAAVAAAAATAAAAASTTTSNGVVPPGARTSAAGTPSILQQTLSAPTAANNATQLLLQSLQQPQQPSLASVVRSAAVLQHQNNSNTMSLLPQTPHPQSHTLLTHDSMEATESNNGGEQEMAISAIMQSLMKDSAQFEVDNGSKPTQASGSSGGALVGVGGAQLPTCPVPQSSLANVALSSGSTTSSPVKFPTTPQSPTTGSALLAKRVSLKNLLSAQVASGQPQSDSSSSPIKSPQQHTVKVTMSQLAAQLSRPVTITCSSGLPTYTQALADQAQVKAAQSSPSRPMLLVTSQHHHQQPILMRSLSETSNGGGGKIDGSSLQALLSSSNSNNASDIIPVELGGNASNNSSGGGSLLERLVSGQPITPMSNNVSASPTSVTSSPARSMADSTNEITLAALLSKPPSMSSPLAAASPSSQIGSPTKASPLIQQLQQPIPPPRTPVLQLPQSPRQQPQSSPRGITSPARPGISASPQHHIRQTSNLQQQLMQPPKSMVSVPLPVQEINSLHNGNSNLHNGNGNNMLSLQNLLQGGMAVQVSQQQQTAITSNSIPVQLSIPGLSAPVTLSLNVQDHQQLQHHHQQLQQQQPKLVPTSTVVTISAAAGTNNVGQTGTVLIPQGSNIIQLPQQPSASVMNPNYTTMRMSTGQTVQLHAANANNLIKGAQMVQVRGQPLYVQMPVTSATSVNQGGGGQSIQIVRSVDQQMSVRQHFATTGQQHLILNSVNALKTSPSLITLPHQQQQQQQMVGQQPQQVVLQTNNAVLQQQGGQQVSQPRQVSIQLQQDQPPNLAKVVNNQSSAAAAAASAAAVNSQRMRQQRKQSLK